MDSRPPPSQLTGYLRGQLTAASENGHRREPLLSGRSLEQWRVLQDEIERLQRDVSRSADRDTEATLVREVEQVAAEVALLANSARPPALSAGVSSSRRPSRTDQR